MPRLHLLVEGQTEETVARDILGPHLERYGWYVSRSVIKTKRPAAGPAYKGGVTRWSQVWREVSLLLRDTSIDVLTTLMDYYGFPEDSPGMGDRPKRDCLVSVAHVERALADAIGDDRFQPHLVLHELEAWVFAAADQLGEYYGDPGLAARLTKDAQDAGGPELVNDGPATAPSKRLLSYRPDYSKAVVGPLAIADLGLPELRTRCPRLDAWLRDLELRAGPR